jgi:hypothetical protein
MELTRRGLLGIGATVGVAGCLSAGGSNVSYPETPTDVALAEAAAESERASAAATEDEPPRETDSSAPNPQLAAELERVYGGIEWFATDYDDAVDTYRRVLGKAVATVERVRDRAAFDDGSLGLVRGATDRAVAVAERELGDHFGIADLMREEVDGHLATIRRFADRGDLDRVDEELERLGEYLAGIRSELFVRRVLSDRQIDAELYRHLHDRTVDSEDGGDGDGDDEPDPGLFELYHDSGYAGYAYAGPRYVDRDPFGDDADDDRNEGRELLARQRVAFDPVGEATDRTGYAYVVSYAVPDEPAQPADLEPLDYDHASLFVQRYADADAASAAVGTLFDTVVGREGTYSFGRDDWHRIYYQAGGDVVYAFLIRAGPFVVVAAPSEVAWEERVDWTAALDRLWLWRP